MLKRLFGIGKDSIDVVKKTPLSIGANVVLNYAIEKMTEKETDTKKKMKKQAMINGVVAIGTLLIPKTNYLSKEFLFINSVSNVIANYTRASEDTKIVANAKYLNADDELENLLNSEDIDSMEVIEEEEQQIIEDEEIY